MPLKETSKLNWSRSKLSQNVVVRCLNLFMPSSLWTGTLSPAALMWVSAVFWALLLMPRSLRSPLHTVPMDSGPRGPHSDMCLGGFTPHFLSPSEVIFQQKTLMEKHPAKQAFEASAVAAVGILFPGGRGTQQAEEWESRKGRFPRHN